MVAVLSIAAVFPFDKKFKPPKAYVIVPAGEAQFNEVEQSTAEFYISKTEVSNASYQVFLQSLTADERQKARIQEEYWGENEEPFKNLYATHPAYSNYPVVNISYEGAQMYCEWLTENYQKTHPKTPYKVEFRLPTQLEWIRAARLDKHLAPYSWAGYYLQNSKGDWLCNFRRLGENNVRYNQETKEYEAISPKMMNNQQTHLTSPVDSYVENEIGAYNFCGNVAEMVAEEGIAVGGSWNSGGYDVRVESTMTYTHPMPEIGFRPVMKVVNIE